MKSIIQKDESVCYLCAVLNCDYSHKRTEKHHIFGGPDRRMSEKYGLTVRLCPEHHRSGPYAVHSSKETMQILHEVGEESFIGQCTQEGMNRQQAIEKFRHIFRKNYVEEMPTP